MTKIEEVARASCLSTCVATDCERYNDCQAVALGSELIRARAAIAAMRNPTEKMIEKCAINFAGCALPNETNHADGWFDHMSETQREEIRLYARTIYLAGINAALAEDTP